jgi:hypothetical protein
MIGKGEAKSARQAVRREVVYRLSAARYRRVAEASPASRGAKPTSRTAVLVVHGMGQQIPFETLEKLTERLTGMDVPAVPASEAPTPILANVAFGDLRLQRIEVTLRRATEQLETHLYEAYWAPTTEGEVFFFDVLRFCASGTWDALRHLLAPFYRWMFGRAVPFHRPVLPFLILSGLTIAIIEVALLNGLLLALGIAHLLCFCWPTPEILSSVNRLVGMFLAFLAAGYAGIGFALFAIAYFRARIVRRLTQWLAWILCIGAAAASIAVLPAIAATWVGWIVPAFVREAFAWASGGWPAAGVWLGVLLSSIAARYFVIQYVGDVAAYVSPQSLDRFSDLRTEIKECVGKIAGAILAAETPEGELEYDRVAFVGHSLGSVIAYDVLNRLILDDNLGVASLGADDRVRLLLTFGSPLDKTAMIFGLNGEGTGVLREQLAARVQPLIEDYRFRRLSWVNVFSAADFFSGELDFYDDEANPLYPSRKVVNLRDEDAAVPLAAHEQYWDTDTVWRVLHQELFDPGATARAVPTPPIRRLF